MLLIIAFTARHTVQHRRMLYATGRYGSFEGFEPIPQKIWQMWITDRNTSVSFFEDRGRLTYTTNWMEKNPDYRYELLTDNAVRTYVRTKYRHRQDIVDTYERITDVILAADYIRYLAILADGGLYTDVDTECTVPVDDWIPPEHRNRTGLVVGIEYDAQDGEIQGDFDLRVQLCQWTFMGRAGHPVMQHVVEQITKALQSFAPNGSAIAVTEGNFEDILWLTGPRVGSRIRPNRRDPSS